MIRTNWVPFLLMVFGMVCASAEAQLVLWDPADGGNGHHYQRIDDFLTWDQARAAAEGMTFDGVSGHLVSITSQAENDFVFGILEDHGEAWIGLNDQDVEGTYVWTTGEPVGYLNWAAGEPNDAGAGEDAVTMIQPGEWNDLWTGQAARYIVEFDTPYVETYIDTIAGGPIEPLDGGPAREARVSFAISLVVGPDGRVYFGDNQQHRVRVIDPDNNFHIETYAGNGVPGWSGDGGPATEARLNSPSSLAFDSEGNLYIGDGVAHVIRRVDSDTGIITTVVGTGASGDGGEGGDAGAAELFEASSLLFDSSDNLYIGEFSRVLRVDAVTNILTRFAGNGTQGFSGDGGPATDAQIDGATDLLLDEDNNLVMTDAQNYRIRRVEAGTGIITTIAGIGIRASSGDGGPATEAALMPYSLEHDSQGNLLVADIATQLIRFINKEDDIIGTIAGNGTRGDTGDGGPALLASLDFPASIRLDEHGNLLMAVRDRLRAIDPVGTIDSYAGGTGPRQSRDREDAVVQANLGFPTGLVLDGEGHLIFADTDHHLLRRLDSETGLLSLIAGTRSCGTSGMDGPAVKADLCAPRGLAVTAEGDILVSNFSSDQVLIIDEATGIISRLAGTSRGFSGDGGLAVDAQLSGPISLATHDNGDLFIADVYNHRIRKVSASDGTISTIAGNGSSVTFPPPGPAPGDGGLAVDATLSFPHHIAVLDDDLFIAEFENPRVRHVDLQSGIITTYAGNGSTGFSGEGGLATLAELRFVDALGFDAGGNLLISSRIGKILKVDRVSGIIMNELGNEVRGFEGDGGRPLEASIAGLVGGLAGDPDGSLYLSDTWNKRIRKVTPSSSPCVGITAIPTSECEALKALYDSTGGDSWTDNTNWLQNDDPNSWYGITAWDGHVREINLLFNNLVGELPIEIGHFDYASTIELSQNSLTGELPRRIGGLKRVGFLSMWKNQMTGQLPHTLGKLATMWLLEVGNNDFSGGVPETMSKLSSLEYLRMADNLSLTGMLPPTLANLSNLLELWFWNTNLCEPTTTAFQDWIDSRDKVFSNGLECDEVAFREGFDVLADQND